MIPRHPIWASRAPLWRMWLESWRGGEYFRAASIRESAVTTGAGSVASLGTWTWGSLDAAEQMSIPWLWSHSRESDATYAERVGRSSYRRYSGFACDVLASGVTEPVALPMTRLGPEWLEDVTGTGTDMRTFRRSVATLTAVFGHAWIGADRAMDADAPVYLYALSPLDVIDWQVDKGARLVWALVRERTPFLRPLPFSQLAQTGKPDAPERFRLWTADSTTLYDADGKVIEPASVNALGRVPLEIAYYQPDTSCPEPVGVGVMQDLAPVNLHEYNMRSLRDVILTDTCFPFLAVARAEGETRIDPEAQLELGTDRAVAYDAKGAPPIWVQPSPESVETLTNMIREDVQSIRELAGLKIANEDSAAAISADALRLIRATLDARFSAHAAQLCDAEIRALRMAQEIAGLGPEGVESSWPSDYGAQESGGRLDDIAKSLDAGLRESPQAHAELLKSALQTVLPGAPAKVMRAIEGEIDAKAQEIAKREDDQRKAQVAALQSMKAAPKGMQDGDAHAQGDAAGPPGRAGRNAPPPFGRGSSGAE